MSNHEPLPIDAAPVRAGEPYLLLLPPDEANYPDFAPWEIGTWAGGDWYVLDGFIVHPTRWAPLPDTPKSSRPRYTAWIPAFAVVMVTGALLCGCVSPGSRGAADTTSCVMAIYNAPEFAPLRPHISLNPASPSPEQLSDERLATAGEIRLVSALHASLAPCRQQMLAMATPSIAVIYETTHTAGADNVADLMNRRESWGAYMRRNRDIALEAHRSIIAEQERLAIARQQTAQPITSPFQTWRDIIMARRSTPQTHTTICDPGPNGNVTCHQF